MSIFRSHPSLIYRVLKVQNFLQRFKSPPKILELDHLTVAGDVYFGSDVSLKVSVDMWFDYYFQLSIHQGNCDYRCQSYISHWHSFWIRSGRQSDYRWFAYSGSLACFRSVWANDPCSFCVRVCIWFSVEIKEFIKNCNPIKRQKVSFILRNATKTSGIVGCPTRRQETSSKRTQLRWTAFLVNESRTRIQV